MQNNFHSQNILNQAVIQLQQAGVPSPALDARLLLQHALGYTHEELVRAPEKLLTQEQTRQFNNLIARRSAREPLSHITGKRAFWKDEFTVNSHVLDPRPDSETLIEAMLAQRPDRQKSYKIIDFGTGSGCLMLSLLREYPNAQGTGIDLSESALEVAEHNAKALNLADRALFIHSNWGETLQTRYDMILSNPPYIAEHECSALAPEVKNYEPELALIGGIDGLASYRILMPHIHRCLAHDGVAVLELGAGQAGAVAAIADEAGLHVVAIKSDLGGVERALIINH